MKHFFQKYFFVVWASIMLFFASVSRTFAVDQIEDFTNNKLPQINYNGDAGPVIAKIISYAIVVTSILAVIAITWAGITMILSSGNEEKFRRARTTMIFALVGVGLAGGAYLIVKVISSLNFA